MKKEQIIKEAYLLSEQLLSAGFSPKVEYFGKYRNLYLLCFSGDSELVFDFSAKLGNSNTRANDNMHKAVRKFLNEHKQAA